MKKLWSASNVRTYGGGSSDTGFLEDLSRTIGDYDRPTASVSTGSGKRTVSQQLHRERIMDVADMAALPRGRAVVVASGLRPTLIATQPWSAGKHAQAVTASLARHDPQPETTLAAAQAATVEAGAFERAEAEARTAAGRSPTVGRRAAPTRGPRPAPKQRTTERRLSGGPWCPTRHGVRRRILR